MSIRENVSTLLNQVSMDWLRSSDAVLRFPSCEYLAELRLLAAQGSRKAAFALSVARVTPAPFRR